MLFDDRATPTHSLMFAEPPLAAPRIEAESAFLPAPDPFGRVNTQFAPAARAVPGKLAVVSMVPAGVAV